MEKNKRCIFHIPKDNGYGGYCQAYGNDSGYSITRCNGVSDKERCPHWNKKVRT